jgi:GntR family transcriptional regulator
MLRCVADIPQWDPDAGGPAYVYMRVADHIAARIAAGDLPAEARLPAERDLAAEYAVAIGTARRAVLELRDRGLVVTLPGKGTYVVSPPKGMSDARSLRPIARITTYGLPTGSSRASSRKNSSQAPACRLNVIWPATADGLRHRATRRSAAPRARRDRHCPGAGTYVAQRLKRLAIMNPADALRSVTPIRLRLLAAAITPTPVP